MTTIFVVRCTLCTDKWCGDARRNKFQSSDHQKKKVERRIVRLALPIALALWA